MFSQKILDKFNSKIRLDGDCWLWAGPYHGNGYPLVISEQKRVPAKNISFYMRFGCLDDRGAILVGTTCNNNKCLNPKHIYNRRDFKICCKCETLMSLDMFGKRVNGKTPRGECKKCSVAYTSDWNKKNRVKAARTHKKVSIKRKKYGISLSDFDSLIESQDNKCAICGIDGDVHSKVHKTLFIDHNHETGKVRGLLCTRCNTGLGMFSDNVEHMKNAIRYLQKRKRIYSQPFPQWEIKIFLLRIKQNENKGYESLRAQA